MKTNKRFSQLVIIGARLMVLITMLLVVFTSSVTPAEALPRVGTVEVAAQTGALTAGTGGSVTYQVTVTKANTQNLTVELSISAGLPDGASASFSPSSLVFGSSAAGTQLTSTLTINTTAATPPGDFIFTVQAVRTNGGNGSDLATGDGNLSLQAPVQQSQSITFDPLADMTFGDADFSVGATASSGLAVSFSAVDNCTVDGSLVHLTGAGSCTITASQAGDLYYLPAADGQQTFAIAQASQSITFDPLANMVMGDPDFNLTATASSGLPVSYAAVGGCTVTGDLVHLTSVGSCQITASQVGDVDYLAAADVAQSFDIAQGSQTITFDPLADKTYSDPAFTLTATASSGLSVSYAALGACTVTGDLVTLTDLGLCTITASQAGDANFAPAGDVEQSFNITQGTQTITFDSLPDLSISDPDFTVVATASSGLPVSFAASGACTISGDLVSLMGTGSCTITASQAGDAYYLAAPDVRQTFLIYGAVYDLYAVTGTISLPGGNLPVWGYSTSAGSAAQPGGPVLYFNEGETVQVVLHNMLSEDTALLFQGQDMIPDVTGVAAGGDKTYTFTATRPGTYLYQAGLLPNAQHQVAMGLYGAFVVYPAAAGQAYDAVSSVFDDEEVLVLSDIDPALNASANPAAFDMRSYSPAYFLINGKVYPNTDAILSTAGNRVLLRYVNAGLGAYSMSLLGVTQTAIAMDGSPYAYGHTVVAETIAPGETADMIVSIPSGAADGTQYALFDANMFLHNNKATNSVSGGFGGMLTFLTVSGAAPIGDQIGPLTSGIILTSTSVDATVSDAGRGDSIIVAAEFFIDATGANGSGVAMSGAFAGVTESVNGVISPALSGTHTVYVHGQDSAGNWGPFQSAVIANDLTGPVTSALILTPNPSNGSVKVSISANASDTSAGGSTIAAAEYTIDGGLATSMSVSPAGAQIASLSAMIPAATVNALSEGTHVVAVRSQDSLGNWGNPVQIDLVVDKSGPLASNITASPNPTNGVIGFNSSTPAVRVIASFSDSLSNIAAGEGFIDTIGATGNGYIFLAQDSVFNSPAENGYVDIPLTTLSALSDGNHTLYVHGKDASGNWGDYASAFLVVDKTAPIISALSLIPDTIVQGDPSVNLNINASDSGTGVVSAMYWIDDPGNTTTFTGASKTINTDTMAAGIHTVYVRVKDGAGNWSSVSTVNLYILQAANDAMSVTANTSAVQTVDVAAPGLLANDEPVGYAGLTAALVSAPLRTAGTGLGSVALSCPVSLGTPAIPDVNGNSICTNGAYTLTLNGVGNNGNQRRNSKVGTYSFTYAEMLNGVSSIATVTITVP